MRFDTGSVTAKVDSAPMASGCATKVLVLVEVVIVADRVGPFCCGSVGMPVIAPVIAPVIGAVIGRASRTTPAARSHTMIAIDGCPPGP